MLLELRHGVATMVLPTLKHRAFVLGAPADRQQGQLSLKGLQPVKVLTPLRTIWRITSCWGILQPSWCSLFAVIVQLQLQQKLR